MTLWSRQSTMSQSKLSSSLSQTIDETGYRTNVHIFKKFQVSLSCISSLSAKIVKHTEIIYRLLTPNCLSVFEHFVGMAALKGLENYEPMEKKVL